MSLSDKLIEAVTPHDIFKFKLFGLKITISDTVINMWIVMAVLIIISLIITRNMKTVPYGKQHIAELIVGFINNFTKNLIGHHSKMFAPYIGTIALFLIFSNTISIFNIIPSSHDLYKITHWEFLEHVPAFHIKPPTKDINVTVAMAIMTILTSIIGGIAVKKPSGWLKSFVHPMPVLLPFKILDYFIRPTSLSLRLFGNILGAYIVMELLYIAIPAVLPGFFSIYFDLFDGILQAYVFVFLSSFYIAESVE